MSGGSIFNGEFAQTPTDKNVDMDDDVDDDLLESHFEYVYNGGNDIDWSEGYDEKYEMWLVDNRKKLNLEQNNALNDDFEVKLFKEDVYWPKNHRGKDQKLI
eukprot:14043018-Ditylum_brightwellii.AAC.1